MPISTLQQGQQAWAEDQFNLTFPATAATFTPKRLGPLQQVDRPAPADSVNDPRSAAKVLIAIRRAVLMIPQRRRLRTRSAGCPGWSLRAIRQRDQERSDELSRLRAESRAETPFVFLRRQGWVVLDVSDTQAGAEDNRELQAGGIRGQGAAPSGAEPPTYVQSSGPLSRFQRVPPPPKHPHVHGKQG